MTEPIASDLLASIMAGDMPHKIVDFPRKGKDGAPLGQLAVRILLEEEQMAASAAATAFARKLLKDPKGDASDRGFADIYNLEAAHQVLYRACRDKDDLSKPLFPTPDAIRSHLSTDEVAILFDHYCTLRAEAGPIVAELTSEEMDAWIARLGEASSRFPLDLLSPDALKDLSFTLAKRLHDLQTSTSSYGSPQDAPSPTD